MRESSNHAAWRAKINKLCNNFRTKQLAPVAALAHGPRCMEQPTHLDLFSGIGGFSLAAESCGFRTIAFCEIEPQASLVLNYHWPDVPNLKDITKLCRRCYDCETNPEDTEYVWCNRCNADFGDCECVGTDAFTDEYGFPDLITGGVPCQPTSTLGLQRGTADERWLWPDTIRVMRELRPRFGVFENPPAILTLEAGRAWNGIVSELVASGYTDSYRKSKNLLAESEMRLTPEFLCWLQGYHRDWLRPLVDALATR